VGFKNGNASITGSSPRTGVHVSDVKMHFLVQTATDPPEIAPVELQSSETERYCVHCLQNALKSKKVIFCARGSARVHVM